MRAKEVMKLLGICRQTLYNYRKDGTIKTNSKGKKLYDYDEDSVYALIGLKNNIKGTDIVSYARVSTQKQKDQLIEQNKRIYDSCVARGIVLTKQYSDIKSGMSNERNDFHEMIRRIIKGEISLVVIENKDRLIRFNYDFMESLFKYFGCKILVLNDILDNKSYEQELSEDLISIIHYFTMKNYSHRRKLNKLRKEIENE